MPDAVRGYRPAVIEGIAPRDVPSERVEKTRRPRAAGAARGRRVQVSYAVGVEGGPSRLGDAPPSCAVAR